MLIAERRERAYERKSPGFTLTEATRIRRDIQSGKGVVECPRCAGTLDAIGTHGSGDIVWMTVCPDCRLSVMVHCRAEEVA